MQLNTSTPGVQWLLWRLPLYALFYAAAPAGRGVKLKEVIGRGGHRGGLVEIGEMSRKRPGGGLFHAVGERRVGSG